MTKVQKKVIGILTIPPLVYTLLFIFTPLRQLFSYNITSPETPQWVLILTAFHFFMFIYTAFLFAFCMIHLWGDKTANKNLKLLWSLLLVLLSVFVFPLYWYFRIKRSG